MQGTKLKMRAEFLLQTISLLIICAWLVPPSSESLSSWLAFSRSWCLRLSIVLVFQAISRIILKARGAESYRITPAPGLMQEAPIKDEASAGPPTLAFTRKTLRFPERLLLAICAGVFTYSLAKDWSGIHQLGVSPGGVIALVSSIMGALFSAIFWGVTLRMWAFRDLSIEAWRPWKGSGLRRLTAMLIGIGFLVISAQLAKHFGLWKSGSSTERFAEIAPRWFVGFVCIALLYLFWMPKPSQMIADQPETLHVVPGRDSTRVWPRSL